MTVSAMSRRWGHSRSTLLYYESSGLLRRPPRTGGNYRACGEADLRRLRQIGLYRKVGLSLAAIRTLVDRPGGGGARAVLERRLADIDMEVDTLRGHQYAILRLLGASRSLERKADMTKETWVAIMRKTGFTDDDMHRWHQEFERSAPDDHQAFLEFLQIPHDEVKAIRAWSRREPPA